jgi:flavin-dependent dehydrogenase
MAAVPDRFDVVVIGGGPAGSITAMLLARSGCSVAIVDQPRGGGMSIGETLPPQASKLITALGLSGKFQAQGHRPSPGIVSVWGSAEPWANDFLYSIHGNGWHIDRRKFNAMLTEEATGAGAVFFEAAEIEDCAQDDRGWCLRVSRSGAPHALTCRFAVDARGRCPAGAFGPSRRTVFDRLVAVAALCPPAPHHSPSDYTFIEAVDEGWFYSALLPSSEYIVAYMTDGDIYAAARSRNPAYLENQLAKAPNTRERIAGALPNFRSFSAVTSPRASVAQPTWLAVGDAARSYDPLSGLGLYTAMSMASEAAPIVMELLEGNKKRIADSEHSNREAFAQYQQVRQDYYAKERRWPNSDFWCRRK